MTTGRRLWLSGSVLLAAAMAFTVWSAISLTGLQNSEQARFGQIREGALVAGRAGLATLNTAGHQNAAADVRQWVDVSTGGLREHLKRVQAATVKQIESTKANAVATVDQAALTKLDADTGTATLIAAVTLRITPMSGDASSERSRYRATLTRVGQVWKISALARIPAGG